MPTQIKPCDLFATPDDLKALESWIELHPVQDRIAIMTGAYMAWNLACKLVNGNADDQPESKAVKQNQYQKAVNWALAQGYNLSVQDQSCGPFEYDCEHSTDREEIINCIEGTEMPNVEIHHQALGYLLTFSVIIDGNPDEYINDYTIPNTTSQSWRIQAANQFSEAIDAES